MLLQASDDEWTVNRLAEQARISVGLAHNVFRAMEQNRLVHAIGKGPKQRRVIANRTEALDWLADLDSEASRPGQTIEQPPAVGKFSTPVEIPHPSFSTRRWTESWTLGRPTAQVQNPQRSEL